jgi:hypothetical protein
MSTSTLPRSYSDRMCCKGQASSTSKLIYEALPIFPDDLAKAIIENGHDISPSGLLFHTERSGERFVVVMHSLTKVKGVMGQKNALQNTVVGVEGDMNVTGAVTFQKVTGLEMLLLHDDKVFIPKLTQVESALSAAENSGNAELQPIEDPKVGEEVEISQVCPIPQPIIALFLNGRCIPMECFQRLRAFAEEHHLMTELELPLAWARATFTLQKDNNEIVAPPTLLKDLESHFAALALNMPVEVTYAAARWACSQHCRSRIRVGNDFSGDPVHYSGCTC